MKHLGAIKSAVMSVAVAASSLLSPSACLAEKGAESSPESGALASVPPKRRVALIAVPRDGQSTDSCPRFIVGLEPWKALLLQEGVTLKEEEWASASDLTKVAIGGSGLFRVVEVPPAWRDGKEFPKWNASANNLPDQFLFARYTVGTRGRGIYLRFVDPYSGATLAQSQSTASDMSIAIRRALAELENEVALLPWRCRITGVRNGTMVIDRGYLDGLRDGQQFVGYAIDRTSKGTVAVADEQSLMVYGTKTGSYRLVETGRNFSKVQPVRGAPLLDKGDVLELPEIRLKDRTRNSRGKRLWDKLYHK